MDNELRRRLDVMSEPSGAGDWRGVLRLAERLRDQTQEASGRGPTMFQPRLIVTAVCGLLVILIVTPALAIRTDIFNFSGAERAPQAIQRDFGSLDVGAPPGMEPGVTAEARKVLSIRGADREHSLWVAPTRNGGYCIQVDQLGGGCDRDRQVPLAVEMGRRSMATPVLIWGAVLNDKASSVDLDYEDGRTDSLALTRVTPPIDASFFMVEVPRAREQKGLRPLALIARDTSGNILARDTIGPDVMFTGEFPGHK